MSSPKDSTGWIKLYAGNLVTVACIAIVSIFVWTKPLISSQVTTAHADTISNLPFVVAVAGVSEQVEGEVEKNVGKAQRNLGKVTGQTEGALKQAKGEAKKNVGEVKQKLDQAQDEAEDASESFVESVKDFFD